MKIRLMTYNVGAGKEEREDNADAIREALRREAPDVAALQEVVQWSGYDEPSEDYLQQIIGSEAYGAHRFFSPTLDFERHRDTRKELFVHHLFTDKLDWRQGNALLSRFPFVRLGDSGKPGLPQHVPVFEPPVYEGNRDTDPRAILLARLGVPELDPFVVNAHLSTFLAEREDPARYRPQAQRLEDAQVARFRQARRIVGMLRRYVLDRGHVVFVMGDLNASADEPAIAQVFERESGFVRLVPQIEEPTHPKAPSPIDHILVAPAERVTSYRCRVVDDPDWTISDHRAVVADVEISAG